MTPTMELAMALLAAVGEVALVVLAYRAGAQSQRSSKSVVAPTVALPPQPAPPVIGSKWNVDGDIVLKVISTVLPGDARYFGVGNARHVYSAPRTGGPLVVVEHDGMNQAMDLASFYTIATRSTSGTGPH